MGHMPIIVNLLNMYSKILVLLVCVNISPAFKFKLNQLRNGCYSLKSVNKPDVTYSLSNLIYSYEKAIENDPRVTKVALKQTNFASSSSTKKYIGIEIFKIGSNGTPMLFLIDTGATINLIRPDVAKVLNGNTTPLKGYTNAFGGKNILLIVNLTPYLSNI
jgi:hypothetical protein